MLFALWLLSVSSETSRPVQIGVYRNIEACKMAATNAVLVGPADSAPKYSFLCVQTRGEINRALWGDSPIKFFAWASPQANADGPL
jgi:hypothetical protein